MFHNYFLLLFIIVFILPFSKQMKSKEKLLVFLSDGFRFDYLDAGTPGGLGRFLRDGVRSKYMEPVFPTDTYPNIYSLVTGLYPESHGMMSNFMLDEERQDWFLMHPHPNASHTHWWQNAEPIWVTAIRKGLKCAVFWWFGCEVEIRGVRPTVYEVPRDVYSWNSIYEDTTAALDRVLKMFSHDDVQFSMVYYEDLDYRGHKYGPNSIEMKEALRKLDDIFVKLWNGIRDMNLENEVNVILVSDHGMLSTDSNSVKLIDLSDFVDPLDVKYMIGLGSSAGIIPAPGKLEKVLSSLKMADGISVFKKEDIPDGLHIKKGRNISPIVVYAKDGHFIKKLVNNATRRFLESVSDWSYWKGFHGYGLSEKNMRAVFAAKGPAFRNHFEGEPIKTVDVYNLMCHILDIDPRPNNGTWKNVQSVLTDTLLKYEEL